MFGPDFTSYTLPYIYVGFFVLAIIYFLYTRGQFRTSSMDIGRQLGFTPFSGAPGYILRAELQGLEVLLNILQDIGGRGQPPYFKVKISCRVPNTSCRSLYAYPESTMDLNRPVRLLPPEIKDVVNWDWYTVRGEQAELISKVLPQARRDRGVFQDSCGFRLLELDKGALVCHFAMDGRPRPKQVGEMVRGAVALAALLNTV